MSSKCQRVQLCEDEQSYFQLMEDTKFEKFWDVIQDYSFPAFFVPLSPQTAQLLIDAHTQFVRSRESGCPFSLSQHSGLLELCRAINSGARDKAWIQDNAASAGIFVRLSTRSPKDSVMLRPSLAAELLKEYCVLRQAEEADARTTVASTALHALYRVSVAANRCDCADMCMQLLVESKRIQGDLEHYVAECLRQAAPAPVFNFIVRPFVPFDVENEFRAFVFQRRLTAITQYNELCYFPRLQQCHEDVCQVMTHTTAAVIAQLPSTLHNCVIDFVCIREAEGWSARVVEINPMAEFAGCGLFSFEKDWRVLQGHDAFQFRFQKDASHVALAMKQISSDCKAVITNADIPGLGL